MEDLNRYIEIDVFNIGLKDKPIYVPFWDVERLQYKLGEEHVLGIVDTYRRNSQNSFHKIYPEKMHWDVYEGKCVDPLTFECKRINSSNFTIGETLAYETRMRVLKISQLIDITYQQDDYIVRHGCSLDGYLHPVIGDKIDPDQLYRINFLKPIFHFADGNVVKYEHMIYRFNE